jgi:transposase
MAELKLDNLDRIAADAFDGYIVRKDLVRTFSRQFPVPTYVCEFLLGRYCATTDEGEIQEGLQIVERQLRDRTVKSGAEELFKSRAKETGVVKIIDLISARLDAKTDSYLATLPSLLLKDVSIEGKLVGENERMLTGGFYAEVDLSYDALIAQEKNGRPFSIAALRPIQLSKRDVLDALDRLTEPRFDRSLGMAIARDFLGTAPRESTTMAKPLLPDDLWEIIEPLLPKWTPSPKGGQPPVTNRRVLTGILFVLKTGLPWEDLPCEMNCGCGMTCWRRLRDWQADGTWLKIHKALLEKLRGADKIDWSRALIDSSFVRAAYGGGETGPSPVDRAKPGSKHHVITDANGIPLASGVTAANVNDISELAPLFNAIPPVAGKVGHPRRKPDALQGDLAYDSEPHRQGLREMGVEPVLPEKEIDDQSGLGETRWPVERTLSWMHQNRRLRIRYERRPELHQAFLTLACIKICASALLGGF